MRGKISKRAVDAMRRGKRSAFLWDTKLPGFGVRITPAGVRSYVFQFKIGGRARRLTIGRHGAPWTPDSARREAVRLKAEVARGADPAADRREALKAPTVSEFAERYLKEHAEPKKKTRSAAEDRRLLEKRILPALGRRKLASVTRADVSRLHLAMRETPISANRAVAVLSRMMTLAERWGVRPDGSNPCRHVEKFKERKRERFLSAAELARLGAVIAAAERSCAEPLAALAVVRMLCLSGLRCGEVLALRWEDVDFDRGVLSLADSKVGPRRARLGAAALELLSGLPREEENPHVFPGRRAGAPLVGLPKVWYRLRKRAGLGDVRLHDLRHSFASVAASRGDSLVVIGALLGHREASTTARYAHLSDDPVRAVADSTSRTIADALGALDGDDGGDGGDGGVVSIARARRVRKS